MYDSITEKLEIKSIADSILQGIVENVGCVVYTSNRQKKLRKRLYKLQDEFINSLSDKQKKDYNLLSDMKIDSESSDQIFNIIYGIKIKKAFDYIVNNPWEATNYYENKAIPID